MHVSMVEEKITQHRTMKERTGRSVLEGDLNTSKTVEVANEILNDMQEQRTGGVRFEDDSRYLVRIRRKLGTGIIPDWVGEVAGPPQLFTLQTVDVLTAGKTMMVIDKNNQKRWETKLTYPASSAMMLGSRMPWRDDDWETPVPCVERGNILYFFDQGVLGAFEIATGNARWRLPTVGASELKFDSEGMMYVVTTSAQQEQIKFSDQIDVSRKTVPVIVKVDPHDGRVLWSLKQRGQTCLFSGKFFYGVEAHGGGGVRFGKEVPAHTRLYRLHPRDGRVMWDHIEKQYPVDIDFHGNRIVALFQDEVKVLEFLSLL
jgi:outer membrane protein assembly factor BamB